MGVRSLDRWLLTAMALLVGAIVLWRGSPTPSGDFPVEVWPSYMALHRGDLSGFLELTPTYRGFVLVVGGPMTLARECGRVRRLPDRGLVRPREGLRCDRDPRVGGDGLAYDCLARRARSLGASLWHAILTLVVTAPIAYLALKFGHPEDLLAASAAVGAVLAARAGRVGAAIVLLVLAGLCKQWAVLAILPAALAAPRANLKIALLGGGGAAVVLGVLHALGAEGMHGGLTSVGNLFHGHQWLYPLASNPPPACRCRPERASTVAPAWLSLVIHPLIIALAVPLSAAWWWRAAAAPATATAPWLCSRCSSSSGARWTREHSLLPPADAPGPPRLGDPARANGSDGDASRLACCLGLVRDVPGPLRRGTVPALPRLDRAARLLSRLSALRLAGSEHSQEPPRASGAEPAGAT